MSWLDTLDEIRKTDWSKASDAEREAKAHEVTNICSYAAAVAALVPVPLADVALMLPIHSVMVMTIGNIHGRTMNQAEARRIALELAAVAGLSFAGSAAISALKRLVLPGVGGLLSITAAFALTWGLGRVSIAYFLHPELSRDDLRRVFQEAMKEGKAAFSKEAFDRFRSKNSDVQVPGDDGAPSPSTAEPAPAAAEKKGSEPAPAPKPASKPKPPDETLRPKKRSL
jgi:uncharacterized protein (DUF697 family)